MAVTINPNSCHLEDEDYYLTATLFKMYKKKQNKSDSLIVRFEYPKQIIYELIPEELIEFTNLSKVASSARELGRMV